MATGRDVHKRPSRGAPWAGVEPGPADRPVPAWLRPTTGEHRLPIIVAILVVVGAQLIVRPKYGLHPRWLAPVLEVLLLAVLTVLNPVRMTRASRLGKFLSLAMVAAITVDNVVSATLLDAAIVRGKVGSDAVALLSSGAAIYVTNVIAFGFWFWEIDRGGPFARASGITPHPDFLFPQMISPHFAPDEWEPLFLDYLYVSFTNAVAFSPTDTMPLSRKVKSLMTVQSAVALSTTALVVARAVNILKS